MLIIRDYKVNELPIKGEPNSRYYVLNDDNTVDEYITDKKGNFRRVANSPSIKIGANTVTQSVNTVMFSNSNGVTFGITGSTITASVNTIGGGGSNYVFGNANGISFGTLGSTITADYLQSSNYLLSNQSSLFQQTSLMSNYLTTAMLSNDGTNFVNTSQSSLFQFSSQMSDYLGINYTSHTHSQYINTSQSTLFLTSQSVQTQGNFTFSAGTESTSQGSLILSNSNGLIFGMNNGIITGSYSVPSDYISSNQSSLFQKTADMSDYLQTDYTSHTHSEYININNSSLFRQTSADSELQFTSVMSNYLGTTYSTHTHSQYINTSDGTLFQQTSLMSDYQLIANSSNSLGTTYTSHTHSQYLNTSQSSLFRHTSADSQLQFTSQMSDYLGTGYTTHTHSQYINTSQSSLFQHTSATSAITSNALNTSQSSLFEQSSHTTIFLTTQSGQAFSAGAASSTFQTLSLQDSNGISFSNNAGAIRLTHALQFTSNTSAITSNALNTSISRVINIVANTNSTAGGTASLSSNVSFSAANGITFYTSAGSAIVANFNSASYQQTSNTSAITSNAFNTSASSLFEQSSHTTIFLTSQSNQAFSAQGGSSSFQTIVFTNSNGFSFSNTGGSIWGSYTVPTITNSSLTMQAGASTLSSVSRIAFGDGNGISFGASTSNNGSITITATVKTDYQTSGNYLTTAMASNASTQFVQASAGFNGTNASGTIASNSISISVAAQSLQTQSRFNLSLSGNSTSGGAGYILVSSGVLTLAGGNNITLSQDGNAISISGANAGGAQTGISALVLSNATYSSGTVTFRDGNGISWASTTGQQISITHGLQYSSNMTDYQSTGAYLTTAAQSSQTMIMSISGNVATTNSSRISAGGYVLAGGNGVTIQQSNNSVSLSVATNYQSQGAYLTTADLSQNSSNYFRNWKLTGNTSGTSSSLQGTDLWFQGGTGVTISGSSNSIVFSVKTDYQSSNVNYLTSQSNQAVSAANGSYAFQTLSFSNANNLSFGTSAGSAITASFSQSVDTGKAGTGFTSAGANISLSGTLNTNGLSLSASVAAPGAAAENNNHNLLGANTAGNTTASGSTIGLSGVNLTLSGTNASQIVISAPGTSSLSATGQVSISVNGSTVSIGVPLAVTYSRYNEYKESPMVEGNIGQGSLHLQPWLIPNLQFDRIVLHKAFSNATNSSGSFTVSDWVGIYTQNVSTLSLLYSASGNTNFSGSGTAGSYLSYGGGIKAITLGLTQTLTEGMYWIAIINRTTTAGAAGHTLNQVLNSQMNSTYRGLMGVATNTSNQMSLGFGVYSATTSSMPASIAFTDIRGNSSVFLRPPSVYFMSGTV